MPFLAFQDHCDCALKNISNLDDRTDVDQAVAHIDADLVRRAPP
ncbi:hypothetical protein [Sphaerisporangium aureirubrum]|uniref:Uncharacterized protein n=1 Tax=Sphaerisporangium aureirubrum TaxID=1544736 RepID=A0ABW1NAA1_9ACTN